VSVRELQTNWSSSVVSAARTTNATEQKAQAQRTSSASQSASQSASHPDSQSASKSASKSASQSASQSTSQPAAIYAAGYDHWSALDDLKAAAERIAQPVPDLVLDDSALDAFVAAAELLAKKQGDKAALKKEDKNLQFEVDHVHPSVATFFKAVFQRAKDAFQTACVAVGALALYTEQKGLGAKKLSRKSDLLVFDEMPDSNFALDETVQASAVLTGELKWRLSQEKHRDQLSSTTTNDGINGLQRDYAATLPKGPRAELPFGLGFVSDGVHFVLVRTEVAESGIRSICSKAFDMRNKQELGAVISALGFALVVAASRSFTYTYAMPRAALGGGAEVVVDEIVAATSNSIVFRFRTGAQQSFVGKHVRGDAQCARYAAELAVWKQHGALLLASKYFVHLAPQTTQWHHATVLVYDDDSATSLKLLRDRAPFGSLIDVVIRDAGAALKLLHSAGLAFFDLHPGQIVVTCARDGTPLSAKLVDVETVCPFERSVPADRRVWCMPQFEPRWLTNRPINEMTDAESLALVAAWLLDLQVANDNIPKSRAIRALSAMSARAKLFDDIGLCHGSSPITLNSLVQFRRPG